MLEAKVGSVRLFDWSTVSYICIWIVPLPAGLRTGSRLIVKSAPRKTANQSKKQRIDVTARAMSSASRRVVLVEKCGIKKNGKWRNKLEARRVQCYTSLLACLLACSFVRSYARFVTTLFLDKDFISFISRTRKRALRQPALVRHDYAIIAELSNFYENDDDPIEITVLSACGNISRLDINFFFLNNEFSIL